ncbi:MAG: hypothetical protein LBV51_00195 [Acholeplasmatales bacterium]|jgi:tetrahydromethanopterin S-methyltransferase subunit E|nr:hypothetical protein [Acholeplasmatales bacterium]
MKLILQKLSFSLIKVMAEETITEPITSKFTEIIGWAYLIAGTVLAATGLIWGLIIFLKFATAQGEERKVKEAKEALANFIKGMIVLLIIVIVFPPVVTLIIDQATKGANLPN